MKASCKLFLTAIKNDIKENSKKSVDFSEQKRSVLIDSTNFKHSWFVWPAKKKSISHFPVLFNNTFRGVYSLFDKEPYLSNIYGRAST